MPEATVPALRRASGPGTNSGAGQTMHAARPVRRKNEPGGTRARGNPVTGWRCLAESARARPYVLDDATVAGMIRVHRDQAGDLALFQNQTGRWEAGPGLTAARRAELAAHEKLIAELRELNSEVLAVAAELSHGTIETVLAKSDLQLRAEALPRRPRA